MRRFADRTGKTIDGVDEKAMAELSPTTGRERRELDNTIEVPSFALERASSRTVWLMSATATRPQPRAVPQAASELEWAETNRAARARQARGVKKDRGIDGHQPAALSHYLPIPDRILVTQGVNTYAKGITN